MRKRFESEVCGEKFWRESLTDNILLPTFHGQVTDVDFDTEESAAIWPTDYPDFAQTRHTADRQVRIPKGYQQNRDTPQC
jgi:hypothetical protein